MSDMLPQHTTPVWLAMKYTAWESSFVLKYLLKSLNSAGVNMSYL